MTYYSQYTSTGKWKDSAVTSSTSAVAKHFDTLICHFVLWKKRYFSHNQRHIIWVSYGLSWLEHLYNNFQNTWSANEEGKVERTLASSSSQNGCHKNAKEDDKSLYRKFSSSLMHNCQQNPSQPLWTPTQPSYFFVFFMGMISFQNVWHEGPWKKAIKIKFEAWSIQGGGFNWRYI